MASVTRGSPSRRAARFGPRTYPTSRRIGSIVPGTIVPVAAPMRHGRSQGRGGAQSATPAASQGLDARGTRRRVGLSVRYVGQVERGQASMSVTVLGRFADALMVDATMLVKRTPVLGR